MSHLARALLVMALGAVPVLAAQDAPTPACALLSVAEVRTITGRQNYPDHVDGDPDGEGFGGGSSCQYGGLSMLPGGAPMLSVVLIKGQNWIEPGRRSTLPEGCRREPVAGVGEAAFFESCTASRLRRSAPLYVKAGTNELIVQMDLEPPATEASVRPIVIAIAQAAVLKLR